MIINVRKRLNRYHKVGFEVSSCVGKDVLIYSLIFFVSLHFGGHGHLKFRAGSIFPVQVCTVSPGHWVNKADFRLNLLLLEAQRGYTPQHNREGGVHTST